jgi:hypothetical protein
LVFGIIWWSMGELNRDVFLSLGFFSLLTLMLAMHTRRRTSRAWSGVVTDKTIRELRLRGGARAEERVEQRFEIVIETSRGRNVELSCPQAFFGYVNIGDTLLKVPGFDWPEKAELDHGYRVCISCGDVLGAADGNCPRCRAPVPDHASIVRIVEPPGA